jgi:RAB protein geranylgeranyltransferase component A
MNDLPQEYDAIIIGTGLTETILSSALSRIGKTVLHIDK